MFLIAQFLARKEEERRARIEREDEEAANPGYPVMWGSSSGPTSWPWSAVLSCRTRLQKRIDLNATRKSLFEALDKAYSGKA